MRSRRPAIMAAYAAARVVDGGHRDRAAVLVRNVRVRRRSDGPNAGDDRDDDGGATNDHHDDHRYDDSHDDDDDDDDLDIHVDGANRVNERVDGGRRRDLDDRASVRGWLPD